MIAQAHPRHDLVNAHGDRAFKLYSMTQIGNETCPIRPHLTLLSDNYPPLEAEKAAGNARRLL